MQKLLILLIPITLSGFFAYGQLEQTSPKRIRKNAVQVSAGFGGVIAAYNANYERLIIQFEDNSLVGLWGKVGLGEWGEYGNNGGSYQQLMMGILTGKNKGHLELNLGGARMYNKRGFENYWMINDPQIKPVKADYVQLNLVGSIGYRYQNPNGNFVFRTGLGYPEGAFIGLGVAF